MSSTNTRTNTFTSTDIKKTFEGCEADIRAIARRTGKWEVEYVEEIIHDILLLAEEGFLSSVSITLVSNSNEPIRAAKFSVTPDGKAVSSDRPGKNTDWENLPDTQLRVILSYTEMWNSSVSLNNRLKISWGSTIIDNNFPSLSNSQSQLYGSNGYELQKMDYK